MRCPVSRSYVWDTCTTIHGRRSRGGRGGGRPLWNLSVGVVPPGVLNAIFSLKWSASHPLINIDSYISYGMKYHTLMM